MNPNDANSTWLTPTPSYNPPEPWVSGAAPDSPTTPDMPVAATTPVYAAPYASIPASPPPEAPRNSRMLILGGIAAAVVVVLLVVAGVVFARSGHGLPGSSSNASTPAATAQQMCKTLQQGSVSGSYGMLSSSVTSVFPATRYTAGMSALTAVKGAITKCVTGTATTTGTSASVPATITYQKTGAESVTWKLSKGSSGWQVAQLPDPAIDPLSAAALYCSDVGQGQLSAAWQLLSPTGQQASGGSESTFVTNMQSDGNLLGALKNCTFQQISISGSSATINLGVDFANNGFSNLPGQFTVAIGSQPPSLIDEVDVLVFGQPIPFPINLGGLSGLNSGA